MSKYFNKCIIITIIIIINTITIIILVIIIMIVMIIIILIIMTILIMIIIMIIVIKNVSRACVVYDDMVYWYTVQYALYIAIYAGVHCSTL